MDSRARRRKVLYPIMLAGLLAIIWASYRSYAGVAGAPAEKPLSDLLTALDEKQVASGTFTNEGDRVDWVDIQGRQYRTFITAGYAATLVDKFHENQLPLGVTQPARSNLLLEVLLPNVILFLVIGGFMWYLLRQTQTNQRRLSAEKPTT